MRQFKRPAIAAAAVILVIFSGWSLLHQGFDSRAAIAKAIDQVRAATAFEFMTTTNVPQLDATVSVKTIVSGSGRMRQEMGDPSPVVNIIDFKQGKMISLIEQTKQAQVIDMVSLSGDAMSQDLVRQFSELDPEHTTYLRDEQRGGVQTHVYQMHNGPMNGQVWIDAEDRLPVAMEVTIPGIDGRPGQTVVMDEFKWDITVDESMFSLDIPEGYQVRQIDMSKPTEADWVLLLRVWAALTEKPFPDEMSPATFASIGQLLYDPSLSPEANQNRLTERVGPLLGEDAFDPEKSEESLMQLSVTLARGTMFVTTLEQNGWRWVGGGVSAGEAGKPLCWWRINNTDTFRVLYGDFTTRDVQEDDLPDIP